MFLNFFFLLPGMRLKKESSKTFECTMLMKREIYSPISFEVSSVENKYKIPENPESNKTILTINFERGVHILRSNFFFSILFSTPVERILFSNIAKNLPRDTMINVERT